MQNCPKMSSIFPCIFLASLLALSSASTFKPTSLSDASNSPANANLTQILQKSSTFCYSNNDCWSSKLGTYSTCVSNYCTCDFGYKNAYSTGKCNKISCSANSDCSTYFANSHCDYTGSCVCDANYVQNSTKAKCENKGACTWSFDCPGTMTACRNHQCVCWSDDYERDSNGDCQYYYQPKKALSVFLGVLGTITFITLVVVVIILVCQRRRTTGRVIQLPGGPGTGPQQPGFAVPAGYQAGYQAAPPVYPSPYGNFQGQQQPTLAAPTHPKGQPSNVYPNVANM